LIRPSRRRVAAAIPDRGGALFAEISNSLKMSRKFPAPAM
jgi:hypothetical protein